MATFIDFILDAENYLSNYINRVEEAIAMTKMYMEVQSNLATVTSQQASRQVIRSSENTTRAQEKETNKNVRLQLPASTDNKIPVVYGRTTLGGKLVDAEVNTITFNDGSTGSQLELCYTICMTTGTKIDGTPGEITFKNIYWDNQLVYFQEDGVTVLKLEDDTGTTPFDGTGNFDERVSGKIQIFCYNDGSTDQTYPTGGAFEPGEDSSGLGDNLELDARNVMTNWTVNHFMASQVFVCIKILFDPQAGLNRLPNLLFDIDNSIKLPGDVLYDYMTNNIYGAGIPEANIKVTAS